MTKEEIGIKAMKFIDEHETDCLTGFEWMREFAYEVTKELEKENAELLEKLKNQKADYEIYYKSCYNAQKKAEKQLTQLQQENAELKSGCGMCYRKDKEQLTKAKEILNKWLFFHSGPKDYPSPLQSETEQFLSEVEKCGQ